MIDLFDLYQEFCGTVNTSQGGHVRPHLNFVEWVEDISIQIFGAEYAEWEKNQVISDILRTFLKSVNVYVSPVPGQPHDLIKYPKDYYNYSSLRVRATVESKKICGCPGIPSISGATGDTLSMEEDEKAWSQMEQDNEIKEFDAHKVPNNKWGAALNHRLLKPTIEKAIVNQYDGGLKIAPKQIGVVVFDYFRKPEKGTFEYTIINPGAEDEYLQYNKGTSTPLDWDIAAKPAFINGLITKYEQSIKR